MGGSSSAVSITNWGDSQAPFFGAMNQVYLNNQANAGKWAETFLKANKAAREQQKEQYEEWLENQKLWQKIEMAIAALQQAAAFYFADKQYKAAKEAQDHQIEVWKTEKEWAKRYQDLWYNKYRPIEEAFLDEKRNQADYIPRYDEAESRAITLIRQEFARAREKARRCIDPRCIGEIADTERKLRIAEAQAIAGAVNKGYRAEEARKDIKDAQKDEAIFALLQLGRGLQTSSLNALNSASRAAEIAATYKPYAGYQAAVGMTANYWRGFAADKAQYAGQTAQILGRQAAAYSLGQGYTGNTSASTASSFSINAPAVTGTVGGFSHQYSY